MEGENQRRKGHPDKVSHMVQLSQPSRDPFDLRIPVRKFHLLNQKLPVLDKINKISEIQKGRKLKNGYPVSYSEGYSNLVGPSSAISFQHYSVHVVIATSQSPIKQLVHNSQGPKMRQ